MEMTDRELITLPEIRNGTISDENGIALESNVGII